MTTARAFLRTLSLALLAVLLGAAVKAGYMTYAARKDGRPLAIRWEGAVIDRNARDAGASLNECLGKPFFAEHRLWRANQWFSGWSCDTVGDPDAVYSLNHDPAKGAEFFCDAADGPRVGRWFNPDVKLNDLEFVDTWDDPKIRDGACGIFRAAYADLAAGKRVLAHCDAGKDRTGTFVAMTAALAAEARGPLDDATLDAIECDYRKSKALEPAKYGRMRRFLRAVEKEGGVAAFLQARCGLDPAVAAGAAAVFAPPNRTE